MECGKFSKQLKLGTENTYMAINRKCSELEPMG